MERVGDVSAQLDERTARRSGVDELATPPVSASTTPARASTTPARASTCTCTTPARASTSTTPARASTTPAHASKTPARASKTQDHRAVIIHLQLTMYFPKFFFRASKLFV